MSNSPAHPTSTRTLGDGMERKEPYVQEIKIYAKITEEIKQAMLPIEPKSRVINLVPKYCLNDKKTSNIIMSKNKDPRFIPYEPYKAAVRPIKLDVKHRRKRDVEIEDLVTKMSELTTKSALKNNEFISKQHWIKEKDAYEVDLKNLRETKAHLENQIEFQAKVNNELKTLLVAAVGEDLETRVQHLTEDKMCLARALLNSANHLTTHQEQTEWLSGQCEVWRSKFLASSIMVEELSSWKASLTKRNQDVQEILKMLLHDNRTLHNDLEVLYDHLHAIHLKYSNKKKDLKHNNLIDLGKANLELGKLITNLLDIKTDGITKPNRVYTPVEKQAVQILNTPMTVVASQDRLCNALIGAAHSISSDQ